MNKARLKKLLILNLPYVLIGLYATKLGEAWHLADGADMSGKLLHLMDGFAAAFRSPWPSSLSLQTFCWASPLAA